MLRQADGWQQLVRALGVRLRFSEILSGEPFSNRLSVIT
jgi:hypothetical protein